MTAVTGSPRPRFFFKCNDPDLAATIVAVHRPGREISRDRPTSQGEREQAGFRVTADRAIRPGVSGELLEFSRRIPSRIGRQRRNTASGIGTRRYSLDGGSRSE